MRKNIDALIPTIDPALAAAVAAAPKAHPTCPYAGYAVAAPDFDQLFPKPAHTFEDCTISAPEECEVCESSYGAISAELAYLLYGSSHSLISMWRDLSGGPALSAEALLEDMEDVILPPVGVRHAERDQQWLANFVAAVRDIATRLAAGQVPRPRNTAEEVALHAVIDQARHQLEMAGHNADYWREIPEGMPAGMLTDDVDNGALADQLRTFDEVAFEDEDVMMLFSSGLQWLGEDEGSMLHPANWFKPFYSEELAG